MTIRYRVQQWLSTSGSFRDGVSLLEMAGAIAATRRHSPMLQQSFISSKQKTDLRNDLVRLLSQLPADENIAPAAPPPVAAAPQKIPDTPRIIALRKKARGLHKVRSDLKSVLLVRALDEPDRYSDKDRYELAQQIMEDNMPQLDELYAQINRFEDEGIEPADDAAMIKAKTVKQMLRIKSLEPQISRLKKNLKPGDKKAEEKLNTLTEELEGLREDLGL